MMHCEKMVSAKIGGLNISVRVPFIPALLAHSVSFTIKMNLNDSEVNDRMDSSVLCDSKCDYKDSGQNHAHRQVDPNIDPLCDNSAEISNFDKLLYEAL